jgi:hypothetical protein
LGGVSRLEDIASSTEVHESDLVVGFDQQVSRRDITVDDA